MLLTDFPPGLNENDRVVLFDGVCKLCSAWAQFLITYDVHRRYKLASVQSREGQEILAWCGLPTHEYDTLVLVCGDRTYLRSTAVIRILYGLPFPWCMASVAWLIPRPLRDWLYDRVAQNRYTLFGKYNSCMIPSANHKGRFLGEGE